MSSVSSENILKSTKRIYNDLEALKEEHESIRLQISSDIDNNLINEKIFIINKNLESINIGLEDAQIIIQLTDYIEQIECDKMKLEYKIKQLTKENIWLREQLNININNLKEAKELIVELEEDKKQLEFLNSIKEFDDDIDDKILPQLKTCDTLQELGFDTDIIVTDENFKNSITDTTKHQITNDISTINKTKNHEYETPQRIKIIHQLVVDYSSNGRYEIAIPLCKQALEDLDKTTGKTTPDYATMLNILALLYRDQSKYKEAKELLTEALIIREKYFGKEHYSIASTMNNLALLHSKCNEYKEAEPLLKQALLIKEKIIGNDHYEIGKLLNNLAYICQVQGKYEETEKYYKRSLSIFELNHENNHVNIIKTKSYLCNNYIKQNKLDEAEKLSKEILTNSHKIAYGNDHDKYRILWQIAEDRENDIDLEVDVYQLNKEWQKPFINDKNSPYIIPTMKYLSHCYSKQSKYLAAETIDDAILRLKKRPNYFNDKTMEMSMMGVLEDKSFSSLSRESSSSNIPLPKISNKLLNAFGLQSGIQ